MCSKQKKALCLSPCQWVVGKGCRKGEGISPKPRASPKPIAHKPKPVVGIRLSKTPSPPRWMQGALGLRTPSPTPNRNAPKPGQIPLDDFYTKASASFAGGSRTRLTREWPNWASRPLYVILKEPTVADKKFDDATTHKLFLMARDNGYDRLIIFSLFQRDLKKMLETSFDKESRRDARRLKKRQVYLGSEQIPRNEVPHVVVAWGNDGGGTKAKELLSFLTGQGANILSFGKTTAGNPPTIPSVVKTPKKFLILKPAGKKVAGERLAKILLRKTKGKY